jgi:hypothetical protein
MFSVAEIIMHNTVMANVLRFRNRIYYDMQ